VCTARGGKGREKLVAVWISTRGEASNGDTHECSSGSLPFRERETVALITQIETRGWKSTQENVAQILPAKCTYVCTCA